MNVPASEAQVTKFWVAVMLAPLLSAFATVAVTLALSFLMPGLPGMAALVMAGMLVGLLAGFLLDQTLSAGAMTAAAFSGVVVVLMYWSFRLAVGVTGGWLAALFALIIVPCFLAGAFTPQLLRNRNQQSAG